MSDLMLKLFGLKKSNKEEKGEKEGTRVMKKYHLRLPPQLQLSHSTSFYLQLLRLERCHLLFSFVLNGSGVYNMHVFLGYVKSGPSSR